jgi:NAD(P)-dependent dehydrogenase (short-subunit alcohol dehydrogenase family)
MGEDRNQRVALVTGATRGAGRAIAVELARAGLFVYATGRSSRRLGSSEIGRPETIEETGDLMGDAGGAGRAMVVDHEDPKAVGALVAAIERECGRLDVLVNDIFGGDRYMEWDKPLWEHDLANGLRMLAMGVHTHLITSHAAIPLMLRTAADHGARGQVVEVTDGTGVMCAPRRRASGSPSRPRTSAAVSRRSRVPVTPIAGAGQWRLPASLPTPTTSPTSTSPTSTAASPTASIHRVQGMGPRRRRGDRAVPLTWLPVTRLHQTW